MESSDYKISLDLLRMSALVSLSCRQGDTGRRICINLTQDGTPYNIAPGCYAVFAGKKPDDKVLWNGCTIEGNTIIYELTDQTLAVTGWVPVQILLYGNNGKRLASPDFVLLVDEPVVRDAAVMAESANEITALTQLIGEATALIEEMEGFSDGASAYEIALENGFEGTEAEWLESLKGAQGNTGAAGADGGYYTPEVTQPTDDTMQVAFTPSKEEMPSVAPVTVKLPVGSGSSSSSNVNGRFVVTFSLVDGEYAANKTFNETKEAFNSGRTITARYGHYFYDLYSDGGGEGFGFIDRDRTNNSYRMMWLWDDDSVTEQDGNISINHPVESVNGKTGEVRLTASDVGALPEDELQTAIDEALEQAKTSGDFQGEPGDDYVLTDSDKQEIAELAAGLVGTPSGGGTEWETLANVTLEEDAFPIVDIGAYAVNFRALRFFVILPACTPANVTFALSIPNSTTGKAYNVCTVNNFGDESAVSKLFIEFEPLIEEGFCRVGYTWAATPTTNVKVGEVKYQYNSYDYNRLETARYLRPSMTLPAGTTITVKGARA